jgi:thiol:disulfide interchange protein DsbA
MNRRDFSSALLATGASRLAALRTGAARAQAPVEGRDYTLIQPPQPPANPAKIEVCEFFSYACPHCSAFEPMIGPWARACPPTSCSAASR